MLKKQNMYPRYGISSVNKKMKECLVCIQIYDFESICTTLVYVYITVLRVKL